MKTRIDKEDEYRVHILIVSPEQFPLPGSGSVEICILAIAEQLSQHHLVTVISPLFSHQTEETWRNPKLRIKRIIVAKHPSEYSKAVIKTITQLEQPVDIIQVDNRPRSMSRIKEAFPSIPVVLFLHSLTFIPPQNRLITSSLQKADLIVTNSKSLKRAVLRRFPIQAKKITHIALGVDHFRFKPLHETEKQVYYELYGLPADRFHILYVGRLIPQKGISTLIRAIHHLKPGIRSKTHLIIAGRTKSKAYRNTLQKLAQKLHVSVTFLGEIPHEQIHTLYPLASCMVCPSQKHEAFGLVNIEALSCGIPVIASSNGGMKEIITHGYNGFLVTRYKQAKNFTSHLSHLAQSAELLSLMGDNGRTTVLERYAWQVTAQKLESVYMNLL